MSKKFKIGAIVCVGTVVAAVFTRGVKAIIDDIKFDEDMLDNSEEDEEDFYEDESLFENEDVPKVSSDEVSDDNSHANFTETDDDIPVDTNADEAADKTVSSENVEE